MNSANIMKRLPIILILSFIFLFCASPSGAATVRVKIIQSRSQYPAGGSYPIQFLLRVKSPWYIHGTEAGKEGLIPTRLFFPDSPVIKVEGIKFPASKQKRFEYTKSPIEVFSGEFRVRARVIINKKAPGGEQVIKGKLSFQACSADSCLPPETVSVSLSMNITSPVADTKAKNLPILGTEDRDSVPDQPMPGSATGAGLWLTLIGIFLGGLALNLTPCIYPLIPITVSYFGGRGEKFGRKIIFHGILYISGLALTNSILGLTASLSGAMLGTVLQNPIVLLVVAGILIGLATSFFGLWELRIPSGLTNLASKNFGGYFGSFFMGLTLGIVAAPCLGPFILGLLTYVGQKGDPFLGFLYFFVLSIGMGLPLAVLAIFSGALEKLPMSGGWMVWIRKVLGWVLVGMAGYLLQPLMPGASERVILFAMISVAAGVHLGWLDRSSQDSRLFSTVKKGLGLVLIIGAISFFFVTPRHVEGVRWVPYDKGILTQAFDEKRPVILDFYADWCGPCKAMERNVFTAPEVVKLSKDFRNIRVDLTKRHPEQDLVLKRYQVRGVPTIIFLNNQGTEEKGLRIESYVDKGEVLKRMKQAIRLSSP
jgi:thioredoxin:protein disulfide reductase